MGGLANEPGKPAFLRLWAEDVSAFVHCIMRACEQVMELCRYAGVVGLVSPRWGWGSSLLRGVGLKVGQRRRDAQTPAFLRLWRGELLPCIMCACEQPMGLCGRLEEAAQQPGGVLPQPVTQLVRHGPGRLVRHRQFALQKFGRDAALVAAHQVGGKKPLRDIRPRPMQHRSRGYRLLAVAGGAFIDPRARLEPPGLPSAAAGTDKSAGPGKPCQVLDAPLLRPKPGREFQKPAIRSPFCRPELCYPPRGPSQEHLENISYPDRNIATSKLY
jgi:hypothetical protein